MYKRECKINDVKYYFYDITLCARDHRLDINILPFSIRVLLENTLRYYDDDAICGIIKKYSDLSYNECDVNFFPARILMQDFTGVPAIVDLAAMRDAVKDPNKINPKIPVDLVIDHSIQVEKYGSTDALAYNSEIEFQRNIERYKFLKWGQSSLDNFRVVPPGTGICHQVNIEYLSQVVFEDNGVLYPDTLLGTDSHTTMANALGILGWGVGGIEAEAAMLGEPLVMVLPKVVGVELIGQLPDSVTATDLVLTITEKLRQLGVVNKFVEFFGDGLQYLSLADRATISNMAPEYGATCGFFPVDKEVIKYLTLTGRDEHKIQLCEEYTKLQNLWCESSIDCQKIQYDEKIVIDLSKIQLSIAGPKRPQDRLNLEDVSKNFHVLASTKSKDYYEYSNLRLKHGSVVIAAITSCTNTSNPYAMISAGLLAKKAVELGLKSQPWVKTSFAPGSQVLAEYLKNAGLQDYLDALGFNLVGFGCTTCIGNSGPLKPEVEKLIADNNLIAVSVLSGNRNFEGRIHPLVRANYLAAPLLCVAYAIVGDININLMTDPLGSDKNGNTVFLHDILPTNSEVNSVIQDILSRELFFQKYQSVFEGDSHWQNIAIEQSKVYSWDETSTYIKNPPYFDTQRKISRLIDIRNAKILAIFGDSVTTDHISPAGNVSNTSPAGKYLIAQGISKGEFNSYGARRGNHEVMMRGTFANTRIRNKIVPEIEGGFTKYCDDVMSIFDATQEYAKHNIPLVIFAGKEYGTGSSRDWAAKGTYLLGVRAVIAESFERIHRSNLVGMGVIPIQLQQTLDSLNLTGNEEIQLLGLNTDIKPKQKLQLKINNDIIEVVVRIDTEREIEYLKAGGIMQYVIAKND